LADSLLVWLVLRKLQIPGAFLAALLFAVHPVNVESVAWIAQRKNLLAMLFALVSVWAYLKSQFTIDSVAPGSTGGGAAAKQAIKFDRAVKKPRIEPGAKERSRKWSNVWYALSLVAFALAMLSKGSVAVVPIVLLLIAWWQRNRIGRADLIRTAPFFVVAAALTLVNMWFQTHGQEVIRHAGIAERLAGAGAIVWFYLGKAIWPRDLQFVYPLWEIHTDEFRWWLPTIAAVAVTVLLVWQRSNRWLRPALFAWAYFCIALLPVMGFADVYFMKYSLVADHYEHLALIGVVALVAAGLCTLLPRFKDTFISEGMVRSALVATALVLVLECILISRRQSEMYVDESTLYETALKLNPDSWHALTQLGSIRNDAGRPYDAIPLLERALKLRPDFPEIEYDLGMARRQIANGHLSNSAVEKLHLAAAEHFVRALKIQPDWLEAHYNAGQEFLAANEPREAIPQFEAILKDKPDSPAAHSGLGDAYSQLEQWPDAVAEYRRALDSVPEHVVARFRLGIALSKLGQLDKAANQFRQVVELKPDFENAIEQLALILLQQGRVDAARSLIGEAKARAHSQNNPAQLVELTRFEQLHRTELSSGETGK
jgi:tetratricopeptide (TPR) repeat protein